MSSHSEDLEVDEPPTVEPYEVLGIGKTATADQVKSAYRKAALKWHPGNFSHCDIHHSGVLIVSLDKAKSEDKHAAHTKFQEVALAYAVLSDERRRKRYDTTGRTDESLDIDDDLFNWGDFYREQFADVINPDSIAKFTSDYKGSDEERKALLAAYTKFKGNMTKIYEHVMVSNPAEDDARFRDIINEAIESEDVEAFEKFTKESKKSIKARITEATGEGAEAEDLAKELGVHEKLFGKTKGKKAGKRTSSGGEDALAALIQGRQKTRSTDDFLTNLEAKYAPKKKAGNKRTEPPEEAFKETARGAKKVKRKA